MENKSIRERLLENYSPAQVVCRVKILGEEVPVSRDNALRLFGCRPPEEKTEAVKESLKVHVVLEFGCAENAHVYTELPKAQAKLDEIKKSEEFNEDEDDAQLFQDVEVE